MVAKLYTDTKMYTDECSDTNCMTVLLILHHYYCSGLKQQMSFLPLRLTFTSWRDR